MQCAHCGNVAEAMTKRGGEYYCADSFPSVIPCWAQVAIYQHETPCDPCTSRRELISIKHHAILDRLTEQTTDCE